jgi:hypothetical protein
VTDDKRTAGANHQEGRRDDACPECGHLWSAGQHCQKAPAATKCGDRRVLSWPETYLTVFGHVAGGSLGEDRDRISADLHR